VFCSVLVAFLFVVCCLSVYYANQTHYVIHGIAFGAGTAGETLPMRPMQHDVQPAAQLENTSTYSL
jgi:hypothetical protein